MTYTVIRPFKDMRDTEQHEYKIDDVFPRKGYEPDQEFVKSLLTGFNSAGSIFITDEVVKKATKKVEEAAEEVEETAEKAEETTEEVKEATEEVEEATEEVKEATEEVEEATEEKPKRKKATKKEEE
jgi:peptidoglycan hydrolase CwlO-like protein